MSQLKGDKKKLEDLFEILGKEIECFEVFLKASKDKAQYIINRKTEELQKLNEDEQAWVERIKELETNREKCVIGIFNHLDQASNLTLTAISSLLDDENANQLNLLKDQLNDLIMQVKNANEMNAILLKNSMEYVDFVLNMVSNAQGISDNSYEKGGKLLEKSETRRVMDFKL